jgi:hypothetical protein
VRYTEPPKIISDLAMKSRRVAALLLGDHLQAINLSFGEQLARLLDELLSCFAVQMGFAGGFGVERVEDPIDPGFAFDLPGMPRQSSSFASYQRGLFLEERLDLCFFPRYSFHLNK